MRVWGTLVWSEGVGALVWSEGVSSIPEGHK